ncbi:MAG: non-ribosomal peptide synthetase [Gallionellaceae bacterium]
MRDQQQRIANLSPEKRALLMRKLRKAGNGIPPLKDRSSLPLSFAQQRLWFVDQMDTGSAMYNVSLVRRLSGLLNVEALERSINELVRRHETLRTIFMKIDGEPIQLIAPFTAAPLVVLEMGGLTEAEARQQARLEARTPFDLSVGPLIRSRLIRLSAEEHVLVIIVHHIVFDGWSMGVMLREISALYGAYLRGLPSPLPELPIQYADYAVWQRQWLKGEVLNRQLNYWKQQLAGAPVTELPTDRPRPVMQSHRGASMEVTLPASLTSALGQIGRQEGATLFMALLAAFQGLLHRYTGQQDIVVGAPVAGRNQPEIAGLIGFFVNTLVMRGDLSGDPGFRELLARIREMAREAYTHQDLPFEKLVSELAPQRSLSRHPLFQIMFVLQNAANGGWTLDGLSATPIRFESGTAKFDLLLSLTEVSGGMQGFIEYSTDLFDASTIARMVLHFQTLLGGIAENPQARLSELPLLTDAERRQLLVEWNSTARDYPRNLCIHHLFEAQVARTPDAVALAHEGQQLSYAELNARANRLAHALIAQGVTADEPVAIALERSPAMIVALLAILKAGGAYIPLDPDYPDERLTFMLEDSGARILITLEILRQRMSQNVKHIFCLDTETFIAEQPELNPERPVAPEHLAYIIYTSGSTGKPKGVAMPHAPLCNLIAWQLQNTPGIRANTLQYTTLSFDVSFQEIFSTFAAGGCLFLIENDVRRDGLALLRLIQAQKIERLFMPYVALANLSEMAAQSGFIPNTLRCVFTAGEQLRITPAITHLFEKTGASLHNHYGPTESHVVTSYDLCKDVTSWPALPPIGRPIANVQLYILDHHLQPVPVGIPGELHIGGACLARGYLNRPELTAEKFIANPFGDEPDARLYKTGDRVRYLPDGNIEFLGRLDQQVKIRGFRIEPGEIEATLLQHPAVLNAVAQARDANSGGKILAAFIAKKQEASLTLQELRDFLGQRLPAHLIPGRIFLVNKLPVNANGKVDRVALMNTPLPNNATQAGHQPAYNALQATLLQIWSGLLEIEEIGINDNFFELGGDSYGAVTMLYRVEKLTKWSVPLATIYNNPTVESLAQAMLEHKGEYHRSPLVKIQAGTSGPPFFFMHGDFHGGGFYCYQLARFMGPSQAFYAIQPHGLPGRPLPTTIEDMAAEYLALIRAAFPEGPYFLGGHCSGALVAFEMAQRLLDEGRKVELLVMMDPSPLQGNVVSFSTTGTQRPALGRTDKSITNIDLDKLSPGDRHNTVMQLYMDICKNYAPKFYQGKLTLFVAKDNLGIPDPARGWRSMAATGEIHVVPGNHISMLTVNAPAIAKELMECRSKVKWG